MGVAVISESGVEEEEEKWVVRKEELGVDCASKGSAIDKEKHG